MIALRPFFMLAGRASMFWMGALVFFSVSMTVTGVVQPDTRLGLYLDGIFLAAFAFPVTAGLLAGSVIQEFQHTSFATVLPGVRPRIASGFLAAGLAVTTIVGVGIALASSTPQNLAVLFVVGLGAYGLGGIVIDPLSNWITSLNVVLVVFVIVRSRDMARIAVDHPWITVAVSLAIGVAGFIRLFARSTFRRKPFCPTSPFPGRFSLKRSREVQLQRRLKDLPRRTGWRSGYLGDDAWRWVRAAIHEVYGALGWKAISKSIGRAWGLFALIVIYAWVDKGDMSFGEALARSLYDALFRSPHQPQFGEHGGPYPLVAIGLAAAGFVTALFAAVALGDAVAYPLSRRQRARVLFRGGIVDAAIFLFVVGPCLFAIGHLAGWFVGYPVRFDFMPFFFRVLMVTVILLPASHWGRIRLRAATRRGAGNTLVGMIFGVSGFVVAVCAAVFVSPGLFNSPAVELGALVVALLVSQWIYRQTLISYTRTADLA